MIRKTIFLFIFTVILFNLITYGIRSGKIDSFLDEHPNPNWVPVLEYYWGQIYSILAKWEKAIYRFKRVVDKFPESKYGHRAQYAIARAYDDSGRRNFAIIEYSKLLEDYPDCEISEISRKRLEYLKGI